MNSTTAVTVWNDKSGQSNTMTGTATWSGGTMVFNGSTNAFSNTAYAFPYAAYSMFAVYSNTTAPASTAYMNAVYGSNGYPMLGVYGASKFVSARSVVANTGALVANVAASSNVLVSATYTPSTFSPFINGTAATTLAGTTLITTGLYLGGPSNYFNGSISELLVFGTTLTNAQRQSVEGYLAKKWGITLPTTHPFYTTPPFNRYFSPTDLAGCSLWLDGADNSSMNSATTVTTWNDKSGQSNTMTGTGTWSGSNMTFNGSTQAFSNTTYVFPISAYSMFAVYSNTTAPASTAYMNAVYGSNGYPMLGVYDVNKYVSARSVVANTGALVANVAASSNVLVSATYTPSTFSPFVNGSNATTLAGTTLATTGLFVGGPSNYFNGSISELLIYPSTLSPAQQQQVEGYLIQKWGLRTQTVAGHQYKLIPPAVSQPAQFSEVTPGNWARDWNPYLQSLIASNNSTNATVIPTVSYGTGGASLTPALSTQNYLGGVLAPNGNIYCMPLGASNILIINTTTNAVSYGTGGASLTPALSTQNYLGGVLAPNGNIYCVPYVASNILIINTTTNAVSYGTGGASLTPALSTQAYVDGVLAPNGNIYCVPYGAPNILIINTTTNAVSYGTGGASLSPTLSTQYYQGGVLAPNGNIYCVPSVASNILIINTTTDAVSYGTGGASLSPTLSTQNYVGGVLAPNGNIYYVPSVASNILIINTTTNAVSYGTGGASLTPALSTQNYVGGVLAPNGNIYCVPYVASNILIINTTTNAVSYGTGGPSLTPALSIQNYLGGVLAPNGNIYCVSSVTSNILIISNTYTQKPSSNYCLSAFTNKF